MKRVLILGAGFGGLELATRLSELAPGELSVTLVDQRDSFYVGFSKIDVLFGRSSAAQVQHAYRGLAAPAVSFRQERVLSIDPGTKRVVTSGGTLEADVLVVALGADVDVNATPGLKEGGHEFYTLEGAVAAAPAVAALTKGRVLVSILGVPYKCPPAPFEVALQLHDVLTRRGVRDEVTIDVTSPAPVPLPVTKDGSDAVAQMMAERGIRFVSQTLVTSLEADTRTAVTKSGERLSYDLLLAVPVHRAPPAVVDAGLAPVGGWVAVDPYTLMTKFEDVYAIGDVTTIPVGQGALPKAGAFADRAAGAVAQDIVNRMRGVSERGRFDGAGSCYLEFGEGRVAKIETNFLGGPTPRVAFLGPSAELRAQKVAFGADRIGRWFNRP